MVNQNEQPDKSFNFNIVKPPQFGWLQADLIEEHVDYLWKIIKDHPKNSHKQHLIGNISDSYALIDENNYFQNEVLRPLGNAYFQMSNNNLPIRHYIRTINDYSLDLDSFWFNRQKKHEFNPMHDHGGVYSFVAWLKIPYDCKEEQSLPQFEGTKDSDKKAGQFEFEYYDIFGRKSHYNINLDSTWENKIVFFPSMFNHCAYPFYTSYEDRISVSGNLWLNPFRFNDPKVDENSYKRPEKENKKPEDKIEHFPINTGMGKPDFGNAWQKLKPSAPIAPEKKQDKSDWWGS